VKPKFSVGLEGMKFYAFHGFYEEEQKVGRSFVVDVKLDVYSEIDGEDHLGDTFNYETIYSIVKKEMAVTQKLIETVGYNIKKNLIEASNHDISGIVRIRKESPLLGGEVGASVIEIYV
jgi:dihydroneopterin aldolase